MAENDHRLNRWANLMKVYAPPPPQWHGVSVPLVNNPTVGAGTPLSAATTPPPTSGNSHLLSSSSAPHQQNNVLFPHPQGTPEYHFALETPIPVTQWPGTDTTSLKRPTSDASNPSSLCTPKINTNKNPAEANDVKTNITTSTVQVSIDPSCSTSFLACHSTAVTVLFSSSNIRPSADPFAPRFVRGGHSAQPGKPERNRDGYGQSQGLGQTTAAGRNGKHTTAGHGGKLFVVGTVGFDRPKHIHHFHVRVHERQSGEWPRLSVWKVDRGKFGKRL